MTELDPQRNASEATPQELAMLRQQDELADSEAVDERSRRRAACDHQWTTVKDDGTAHNRCPKCGRWGSFWKY